MIDAMSLHAYYSSLFTPGGVIVLIAVLTFVSFNSRRRGER